MRVSVTREETVERNWECARCDAHGVVVMRAVGDSGWKQVWFDRDEAEASAQEDARWAVQRDADRMLGIIRCPSCRRRARGAYAWAAIRNIPGFFVGLFIGLTLATISILWAGLPFLAGIPIMLACGVLMCWPERRRWVEARNTTVRQLVPGDPEKVALVRARKTAAAMPKATARALPSKKPELLAPVASQAPSSVERPSDTDGPRFLRD
ncbi:MAG TPA: hypothetical protein VM261_25120 [Kofleriaceae bacterium]|nr:hypothetical protein [Kofleriaceae bacterium]